MYASYEQQDDSDGLYQTSDHTDREDDEHDDDREGRFVDDFESTLCKSKSLNDFKPFFNGSTLDSRIAEIRRASYYISHNWDMFDDFLAALRDMMLGGSEFKNKKIRILAETLLTTKRDYLEPEAASEQEVTYEAIQLYTSKEGNAKIFRICNDLLRQNDSTSSVETIRNVVFLVDLINIDLFNYCVKCPEQVNYRGTVYRGMCLAEDEMELFRSLRNEPIEERNISIPTGLLSASSSLEVAHTFINRRLKAQRGDEKRLKPLVFKINIIGLDKQHVAHYNRRFAGSTLTTLYAVDIHKLSKYPEEKEVLLRGPFLLVLDMHQEYVESMGHSCDVLETVMLNDDRDHHTITKLGDLETLARDTFAAMVIVTRSEYAVRYCTEKGLTDDANEYQNILEQNREKLDKLMQQ